jgi:hypothetical protein
MKSDKVVIVVLSILLIAIVAHSQSSGGFGFAPIAPASSNC